MRALVRYHGGKWRIARWIIAQFPEHRVYVEPFGGAGSVLLKKSPVPLEVYNDLYSEMVNLFRIARDRGEELKEKLRLTPFSREEFIQAYEASDCPLEQARRTVARSFMGHGADAVCGTWRVGFRGVRREGIVPAREWVNYAEKFEEIIERLRGVVIENRNALEVISKYDAADAVHYVDPPYVHATRSRMRGYKFEMSDREHACLAERLNGLKGFVALSGYDSALYRRLYRNWRRVERAVFADKAQERTEVLWIKEASR